MIKIASGLIFLSTLISSQTLPPNTLCDKAKSEYIITDSGRILPRGYFQDTLDFNSKVEPWLQRLGSAFSDKGFKVLAIPVPASGSVYVDALNGLKIEKTNFANINFEQINQNYDLYLNALNKSKIDTIDALRELRKAHSINKKIDYYFRADGHWTPESTRLISRNISEFLKEKLPELSQEINKKKYTLSPPEIREFSNGPLIQAITSICEGFNTPAENYSAYKAIEQGDGISLIDDAEPPVALFGSSFSGWSFPDFLRFNLGSEISEGQLDGGGALGSMINYFSSPKPSIKDLKLILWEFPIQGAMGKYWGSLDNITAYRQLIPAILHPGLLLSSQNTTEMKLTTNFSNQASKDKRQYLRLEFSELRLRDFSVELKYGSVSEKLQIQRTHGENISIFYLELPLGRSLSGVKIDIPDKSPGSVKLDLYEYLK
jgi:SGNH hydrolase-like domain, acetyltransferase AlgX